MSSGSGLPPREHAAFAVLSRIVACVVTEGVLPSIFVPAPDKTRTEGILLISSTPQKLGAYSASDTIAIVPLHHHPVLKHSAHLSHLGYDVALVDPLDMIPALYKPSGSEDNGGKDGILDFIIDCISPFHSATDKKLYFRRVSDPMYLWGKLLGLLRLPPGIEESMTDEIKSSFDWQVLAYECPPTCPSLASDAIEWEQSLVAGHPTHPMHRSRSLPSSRLDYDWYHPVIRFARVPRCRLSLLGDFADIGYHLASSAALRGKTSLIQDDNFVYVPIHELQVPNVQSKFPNVEILGPEISLIAHAQLNIRTVLVPELRGFSLKLAIGVKISSALRTVTHFTADFGPRFSAEVVPRLAIDSNIFAIELETSTAVYSSEDKDLAKHLTVIVRENYPREEGEVIIVVACLLESDLAGMPPGIPVVQHILGLDTEEKRVDFLDSYVAMACKALLPILLQNGVAFDAHAQNIMARFDRQTGRLTGFIYRDLAGLRIHPPTLKKSTGVDFQFLPGHCVVASTLEEIYPKLYHTFVHNHVQRLIRVLGLHYNGKGWDILRRHMQEHIPADHPLFKLWLDPESRIVQSKGLLRMRMQDSDRIVVYCSYPNMIQYRPTVPIGLA
jgi:hypothetical protein